MATFFSNKNKFKNLPPITLFIKSYKPLVAVCFFVMNSVLN